MPHINIFSFFYNLIVFNPKETAENLRKYGGYVLANQVREQLSTLKQF